MEKKETKTIASVEKAVLILEAIAESDSGLSVTEISEKLHSSPSAAYHLINTLRQCEMLQQDEQTKKYSLGIGIFRLYAFAQRQNTLASIAQPYLDELSQTCGETSNLLVLQNLQSIYVAQSESNHIIKMFTQIGARVPYYCTGGGKVILAYMPEATQKFYLRETRFIPFTPNTIINAKELSEELAAIRVRGYGFDSGEREEGVICIAAPVFNATGLPIAAVSISGPDYRFNQKERKILSQRVVSTSQQISLRFGWRDV